MNTVETPKSPNTAIKKSVMEEHLEVL